MESLSDNATSDNIIPPIVNLSVRNTSSKLSCQRSNFSPLRAIQLDPSQVNTLGSNMFKKMLVLPAATSASAQVAAMHNYSSAVQPHNTTSRYGIPRSTFKFGASVSAPQSPNVHGIPSVGRPLKQRCAASNPSSPASQRHKSGGSRAGRKRRFEERRNMVTVGSSDSEGEVIKRAQHNVLERNRRNNLKEYFNVLRDAVPILNTEQRTSKVIILQRAREWVKELSETERRNRAELDQSRRHQHELRKRLSWLTQNAAAY